MDSRKDFVFALAIIALGIAVILIARSWDEPLIQDTIGPRAFPYGIGLLFVVGGAFVAVQRVRNMNAAGHYQVSGDGHEDDEGYPASGLRALTLIGLCALYTFLLNPIGFLVATPPFVALALILMNERKPLVVSVTALSFTIVTYLLIHTLLGGRLPPGVLAGLVP
jgi:putative tricarboxylic transport membrane protein